MADVINDIAGFINPFMPAADCAKAGCGKGGWTLAVLGVAPGEGKLAQLTAKVFSKAKQALVARAKADKATGGITVADMEAYRALNQELPDPFPENTVRGPESHPGRPHGQEPHGHVGPVNHIPITDATPPPPRPPPPPPPKKPES